MKIALCFSGQPRALEAGYPYYKKHILGVYPSGTVDVFVHTWAKNEWVDSGADADVFAKIEELYNPTSLKMELEWPNKFDHLPCVDMKRHPSLFGVSQFYSILQSCVLKTRHEAENGFVYDWVIKTRFDYAINRFLPLGISDPTKIHIPNCRMVPTRDFGNDQFAFGGSLVMNKYMSTYLHLPIFSAQGVPVNGENMVSANLKLHGLVGDNLVYVDMNNPFPPGEFNGTPHSLIRDDMEKWKRR